MTPGHARGRGAGTVGTTWYNPTMSGDGLTLASPVLEIDRKLATRRAGFRTKGPPASEVLAAAFEIRTVGDLLHHYPRRYIDRSRVEPIRDVKIGAHVTVIGLVRKVRKRQTRRRQTMVTVTVGDGTGYLDLTFFNQPWAANTYREGVEVAVSGTATLYKGRLQLAQQEVEVLRGGDQTSVTLTLGKFDAERLATAEPGDTQGAAPSEKLGATLAAVTPAAREQLNLPDDVDGVVITSLDGSGLAADAGLEVGDVIVQVDARPVHAPADVEEAIRASKSDAVLFQIERDGARIFVGVRLA